MNKFDGMGEHMRLEQVEAFLAIAKHQNFSQAAQVCGVTQSTISRQIQSLEQCLGLPLFHRSTQATLTVAGEAFLTHARRIVQEWQQAQTHIQELREGKQPELCVAAIHSVCAYFLPPVLQQFCQQYPQTQLRVTALGSDRALKVLRDGLIDLAIVMNNRFLTTSPEMVLEPLYTEEIGVLMAADHPLSRADCVSLEDLMLYPQVVFKDGYGMQRLVQELFESLEQSPRIALELNTLDAFRGVIRQGQMVAMLPQGALQDARRDPQLTIRRLMVPREGRATPVTREVVLVTTRDRLLLPPVRDFFQLAKAIRPQGEQATLEMMG